MAQMGYAVRNGSAQAPGLSPVQIDLRNAGGRDGKLHLRDQRGDLALPAVSVLPKIALL